MILCVNRKRTWPFLLKSFLSVNWEVETDQINNEKENMRIFCPSFLANKIPSYTHTCMQTGVSFSYFICMHHKVLRCWDIDLRTTTPRCSIVPQHKKNNMQKANSSNCNILKGSIISRICINVDNYVTQSFFFTNYVKQLRSVCFCKIWNKH